MLANSMDHPIEIFHIFPARNAGEYPPPFSPAKCWWCLLIVKSHQNISNHRMIIGWSYVDYHGIKFPIWLNSNPRIILWFSKINPLKTKNWSSVAIVILMTTCYNHHKQKTKKTQKLSQPLDFFTTNKYPKVLRSDHPQTVDSGHLRGQNGGLSGFSLDLPRPTVRFLDGIQCGPPVMGMLVNKNPMNIVVK